MSITLNASNRTVSFDLTAVEIAAVRSHLFVVYNSYIQDIKRIKRKPDYRLESDWEEAAEQFEQFAAQVKEYLDVLTKAQGMLFSK